ncbi:MAG: acetylglutamate kinase [Chloroflexi bacterium]|nr:acetylglutamate kinase [Chloroflexota bacterium]MDA1239852.1 acetylglutamate kinase [Chloroflexota bacterium]MQC47874.1 acetylglutamate kinase [Chloroflexota bacterium]
MTNTTPQKRATVIKIGGSTLGSEDTTLQDVAALNRAGERVVVVHGGGAMITEWLKKMEIDSVFVDGLRSTNAAALEVVVGVLRGVVNTQLVGEIVALGGRAVGICGVDGACVRAERYDDRLEYVGRVTSVDGAFIEGLLDAGVIPVIAPIGFEAPNQPLNINADTVAGEVARAIRADSLTFLTDVDGLMDAQKQVLSEVDAATAAALRADGTLAGGMIPKIDACFRAAEAGARALIANGTQPGTLRRIAAGEAIGTLIKG